MYSRDHAILSVPIGILGVVFLDLPVGWPAALVLAVVAGVGIDFDHFVVARATTGEWTALRRCLANPRLVFLGQDEIFEPGSIWPLQRLLSHVVLVGVVVPVTAVVDTALAILLCAVLYVHLLADLLWDTYRQDHYHRQVVAASRDTEAP